MVWTEAEQAIVDYLAAEPGRARQAGPLSPGGWVGFTPSGGAGADPAFPARVDILDNEGVSLASYDADEFDP